MRISLRTHAKLEEQMFAIIKDPKPGNHVHGSVDDSGASSVCRSRTGSTGPATHI
jgi:hypothetical protein